MQEKNGNDKARVLKQKRLTNVSRRKTFKVELAIVIQYICCQIHKISTHGQPAVRCALKNKSGNHTQPWLCKWETCTEDQTMPQNPIPVKQVAFIQRDICLGDEFKYQQ